MHWGRNILSPVLAQARAYLTRIVSLLEARTEPPNSSLLRLERGAASWAPAGPGSLHRRLAEALLQRAIAGLGTLGFPAPIAEYYADDFHRIGDDLAKWPDADLTFERYRFKADLRLLTFRRIPMGMYALDGSVIPRQTFLHQKPFDAWRMARVLLQSGGFSHFFSQHMVPQRVHLFNPEGRARYLDLLAELLKSRPRIRGLLSTAWYNDPVVATISPHLAYLREGLERLGAQTFRIGTSAEVVEDALVKSATRRQLHATGAYVPTAYLIVVPRACLLRARDIPSAQSHDAR